MFNQKEKDILGSMGDLVQLTRYSLKHSQTISSIDLLNSIHFGYERMISSNMSDEKKNEFKQIHLDKIDLLRREAIEVGDNVFLNRLDELFNLKENLIEISEPIGNFVLKNAKGKIGEDGIYFHYSEVCLLLKKYKDELECPK